MIILKSLKIFLFWKQKDRKEKDYTQKLKYGKIKTNILFKDKCIYNVNILLIY